MTDLKRKKPCEWCDDDDVVLCALWEQKISIVDISARMQFNIHLIHRKSRILGLPRRIYSKKGMKYEPCEGKMRMDRLYPNAMPGRK